MGKDRNRRNQERKARRIAYATQADHGSVNGFGINGCDGCSHIKRQDGLMVGCEAGVPCWRAVNCGYKICTTARIEYSNGCKNNH